MILGSLFSTIKTQLIWAAAAISAFAIVLYKAKQSGIEEERNLSVKKTLSNAVEVKNVEDGITRRSADERRRLLEKWNRAQ